MALAIGSIIAVVAVLLSHMDRKDEVNIIPIMSLGKQFNPHSQISNSSFSSLLASWNKEHSWVKGQGWKLFYIYSLSINSMKVPKPTVCFGNPYPVCVSQSQNIKVKFSHHAGFTPTILRTFRAILRCRPHSSIDEAITSPLRKRKLVSRKYWGHTVLDGRIPSVGKRQTGSIAVTARGRASVHQKIAISTTT